MGLSHHCCGLISLASFVPEAWHSAGSADTLPRIYSAVVFLEVISISHHNQSYPLALAFIHALYYVNESS